MSEKPLRRRIPVHRRIKPPHPSVSPSSSSHRLHRKVIVRRSLTKQPLRIKRCNSEPTLLSGGLSICGGGAANGDEYRNMTPPPDNGCALSRRLDFANVFSSSPELLLPPLSPLKTEVMAQLYDKDSKVVVNVTVEGSPGPVRAMVKLGSSVDDTIRLVTNKYNAEGRSPQLDQDAVTTFELHNSYFSLQCLDKSDMIGDIGSRSFYLRKSRNNKEDSASSIDSDIVAIRSNNPPSPTPGPLVLQFQDFIFQKFKKIFRKTRKLWKLFGCIGG